LAVPLAAPDFRVGEGVPQELLAMLLDHPADAQAFDDFSPHTNDFHDTPRTAGVRLHELRGRVIAR
jgi:hypothetical protein